jgi:hypothetical protein
MQIKLLPSVIGGLLHRLISAFDDLSELPTRFGEAEVCWTKAGIHVCDVIGDQTLNVEQMPLQRSISPWWTTSLPIKSISSGVGSIILAHTQQLDAGGQDLEPISGLPESAFLLHAHKVEQHGFIDYATSDVVRYEFVLGGPIRAMRQNAQQVDSLAGCDLEVFGAAGPCFASSTRFSRLGGKLDDIVHGCPSVGADVNNSEAQTTNARSK